MLANTPNTLGDDDFLALATSEIQSYMVELLMSVREEYLLAYSDVSVVSGTAVYPIPTRAIGGKLENVHMSDGNGSYFPLTRIEPSRAHLYTQNGTVSGYVFQGDSLVLLPTPTNSATLRLSYFTRPGKMVATSAVATISSINGARTVITTAATIPTTFGATSSFDIVSHTPGFTGLQTDNAANGTVSGTTITLTTALPSTVIAGNYVCLAGESPVPQLPVELHPLLVQRVVVKCLEALGDSKVNVAKLVCDEMRHMALTLITPRAEASSRFIINYNAPGWQRRFTRR